MFKFLSKIIKNNHKTPHLGRWGIKNRPLGITYYDNCIGPNSNLDKIEFDTITKGCKFMISPSWCTKCFSYIPEKIKKTEFYQEPFLHKSKCLLKSK